MGKSFQNRYARRVVVDAAKFAAPPGVAFANKFKGSRRAGINFERAVGRNLVKGFGLMVLSNIWIEYRSEGEDRICSPDHVIVDVFSGTITIVECKLTHIDTAYYQMVNLYLPVMKRLFPGFKFRGIEICKHFDRSVQYPVGIRLVRKLKGNWEGFYNVHIAR